MPLLVEASVDKFHPFDLIAVMHADAETRIDRLVRLRGYDRAERYIDSTPR